MPMGIDAEQEAHGIPKGAEAPTLTPPLFVLVFLNVITVVDSVSGVNYS